MSSSNSWQPCFKETNPNLPQINEELNKAIETRSKLKKIANETMNWADLMSCKGQKNRWEN